MPDQSENLGGLPLPEDIPFQLIAASPDMMDMTFCNKKYPFEFRSSLAISAYEPDINSLPENYCKRITYLKITASLTGYKPTQSELSENIINFTGTSVEHNFDDWDYITRKYFPCFGALLNVAVFPLNDKHKKDLSKYPHITSFEPKRRELIEPMTKEGSILTSSNNTISLGTKNQTTKNTGFEIKPSLKKTLGAEINGVTASSEASISGTYSHSKNNLEENTLNFSNQSESAIKSSHKTTIEQMYNMLDSYHLGTNRAVFNIMPYPHIKEITDFRTFTQGIKVLEGIQEFFLIVERPRDQKGLCIDVGLQTGHFPEDAEIIPSEPKYRTTTVTFNVTGRVKKGKEYPNEQQINKPFSAPAGYVIDRTRGNGGYSYHITQAGGFANDQWNNTKNIVVNDNGMNVSAKLVARHNGGSSLGITFTVYLRAIEPYTNTVQQVSLDDFMVTSRGLCTCYKYDEPCLDVLEVKQHPTTRGHEIVDEIDLKFNISDETFPLDSLMSTIKNNLYTSGQQPTRNQEGVIGFFDSKFFTRRWIETLDEEYLNQPILEMKNCKKHIPKELLNLTISEFLAYPTSRSKHNKEVSIDQINKFKREILTQNMSKGSEI